MDVRSDFQFQTEETRRFLEVLPEYSYLLFFLGKRFCTHLRKCHFSPKSLDCTENHAQMQSPSKKYGELKLPSGRESLNSRILSQKLFS